MANALHRTTLRYVQSIDMSELPGDLADWIRNPDMSQVEGTNPRHWKLVGDRPELMTAEEIADRDNNEILSAKDDAKRSAKRVFDDSSPDSQSISTVCRAVALVMMDEINDLRSEISNATNLADLKAKVAKTITAAQIKRAIRDKIENID
jgi:hypothetical protein